MSFKRPYDNWQTYTPQPETQRQQAPSWLSPFNIALVAVGIGISFIPGLGEIIPQFIIGESIAAVQTGVMASVGVQPNLYQTTLSFGLPFISSGVGMVRNAKEINVFNDLKMQTQNIVQKASNIKSLNTNINDFRSVIQQLNTETNKFSIFNSNHRNIFNTIENNIENNAQTTMNKLNDLINLNNIDIDYRPLQELMENLSNQSFINDILKTAFSKVSARTINRTVDIEDTMRQFNVPEATIDNIMELFFYAQEGLTEEYRNIYVIRMIEALDIENEFAQGLKNTVAALYNMILKTNAEINVERIFVRAWRDMLYSSPKRFMTRYGFESPLLKLRYETKATSWQEIQKLLSSQKTRRLRQGARMLNPTMVSRSAVNYFARKMTRYVNNLIKNLKKFKQNTDISTDKSGISGMDQENSILRTSKNLAADAFKRLKAGEVIALPSAWLLSIRIIENLIDESLCIITFQQVPTKNKEPVLVWANDKQLLELLDRPGNTYLDYFATSRGGKLVSLGSVLGMRGSIIPPSILHLIGVGLPTQALRNLISIASNVKKAVDGNYLKKWENPQQYLFKNFYLYGVSRGSRLIGRTLMGGMINHILGGKLSSAITGKIGKQLDHTLTHLIPMEGQRLMTTFASTPIRNLLTGRSAFSGMKRAMEINTTRVIRDHTRFFAAQSNRRLGVLQNISIGRKVNLYGRSVSIFTGNSWKRTKW